MSYKKGSSIVDAPRSADENDLLGLDIHAKALKVFINDAVTPLTIAIQGEWGSGKTSMMNQLKSVLCDSKDAEFYGIWINTWQYALLSDEELILSSIVTALTNQTIQRIQKEHPDKYNEKIGKAKEVIGQIFKWGLKIGASKAMGAVGEKLAEYLTNREEELDFTINDLKDRLMDIIVASIIDNGKKKGFIFFIDDLDRIDPTYAVQILELLKNIFEIPYCLFMLAIDYDVVVKGLEPKFGPLTENNEREFRSFFDKIIQLPFSMPVSRYKINDFIVQILERVDYLTEQEIRDENFCAILSLMAEYSVGKNPRALKRLTNSLSLIKIFNDLDEQKEVKNDESWEKLINIGLICCQIAYPFIYRLLNSEPNFKNWNEETATRLKLKPLTEEQLEILRQTEEFDEEWEQVLYRACQKDHHLSNNAHGVSMLLNLIFEQIPKKITKDLGAVINSILSISSVTNVEARDSSNFTSVSNRSKFLGFEEFARQLDPNNKNPEFLSILELIHNDIKETFPDSSVSFSKQRISFFNNDFPRRAKSFVQIGTWKPPARIRVDKAEVNEDLPGNASLDWLKRERWRHFCFEINSKEEYTEQVKKYIKRSYDLAMKGITLES
jgi:hypothetical protein